MGAALTMLGAWSWDSDYIQPHYFIGNTFEDIGEENFAKLIPPSPKWAVIAKCGNFPCTGPLNVLHGFT